MCCDSGSLADSLPRKGNSSAPWALRATARRITTRAGLRQCGCRVLPDQQPTARVYASGDVRWEGVALCRSPLCPVCGSYRGDQQGRAVAAYVEPWRRAGGEVYTAVLTTRHTRDESCTDVLRRVRHAWRRVANGRTAQALRDAGLSSIFRAIEVTHGRNGWHWHVHVLAFVEGGKLPGVARLLRETWERGAGATAHATWDWQPVRSAAHAASYATKALSAMAETTGGARKSGRSGRTPADLLYLATQADDRAGRAEAVLRWREVDEALRGVRLSAWVGRRRLERAVGEHEPWEAPEAEQPVAVVELGDAFFHILRRENEAVLYNARQFTRVIAGYVNDPWAVVSVSLPPPAPPPSEP